MSRKDIKIECEGYLHYIHDKLGNINTSEGKAFSYFFKNDLIPDVKFEIIYCVPNSRICYVILSKKPHTPLNATIAIEFLSFERIERIVHVYRWTDNCTLKIDIRNLLQNRDHLNGDTTCRMKTTYNIKTRCEITWHAFKKPEH